MPDFITQLPWKMVQLSSWPLLGTHRVQNDVSSAPGHHRTLQRWRMVSLCSRSPPAPPGWGEGPGGCQPSPRTLRDSPRARYQLRWWSESPSWAQNTSPSTETVLGCASSYSQVTPCRKAIVAGAAAPCPPLLLSATRPPVPVGRCTDAHAGVMPRCMGWIPHPSKAPTRRCAEPLAPAWHPHPRAMGSPRPRHPRATHVPCTVTLRRCAKLTPSLGVQTLHQQPRGTWACSIVLVNRVHAAPPRRVLQPCTSPPSGVPALCSHMRVAMQPCPATCVQRASLTLSHRRFQPCTVP